MSLREWARKAVANAAAVGSLPSDTAEGQLRKSALVLSSLLITLLSCNWVATYAGKRDGRAVAPERSYEPASSSSSDPVPSEPGLGGR